MDLPLFGIRVIELGQVIAGTYGNMILADLGAEVIKVEPPRGDMGRSNAVAYLRGESGLYLALNRNKKSVGIDLKKEEGLEVFYELVRSSDVVADNFRPGVLERLKVDYEHLKVINPRVISCSITGFGKTGPLRDVPSFDLIHQAFSGHMSITGEPGRPPVRAGIPLADLTAATFSAKGIMAALLARERTGKGQRVEISMFDVQVAMLNYTAAMYLSNGELPDPPGSAHEYMVPYQAFKTKDIYIVVAPREEGFWRKMCEAMGLPHLVDDPRFETNLKRIENRGELIPILQEVFITKGSEEWLRIFSEAGVPAAPVNTLDRALEPTRLKERGMLIEFEYSGIGRVRVVGNPIKLPDSSPTPENPPPTMGQHTDEVLEKILGYPPERRDSLRAAGVIF